MADEESDIAELERRWQAFLSQDHAAPNDQVIRWLRTWGTPTFKTWQVFSSSRSVGTPDQD